MGDSDTQFIVENFLKSIYGGRMLDQSAKKLLPKKKHKKVKRSDSITFRLTPELKDKIQKCADAERRTLSQYIEMILEERFEKV